MIMNCTILIFLAVWSLMKTKNYYLNGDFITCMNNYTLAVVVTYNRLTMLKQCISHICAQSAACDILIVDNASTDDTSKWALHIIGDFDKYKILYENTGTNLGGAGGFNYGMRKSCEYGYKYVWIMDDDAFAQPDCLEKLLDTAHCFEAKKLPFGFLSSAVLWTDGNICKMNWQRKYPLPRKRSEHHVTQKDLNSDLIQVQCATFVSLLFPTDIIKQVGLPIKEFFIWCDDIEYTRRISIKYKIPCYAVPSSRMIHHTANNVGSDLATDSVDRISRYNYAFRNENYMYRQYGVRSFCYYIAVCIYNLIKILFHSHDHRLRRMSVVCKNFFTGLTFNPPIEKL